MAARRKPRKKLRKRPPRWRRRLMKGISDAVGQAIKDRAARRAAAGGAALMPASSRRTEPSVPPMPADYTAIGWDGELVRDPAALRCHWARECGYSGPIDQDGYPAEMGAQDHSDELVWADSSPNDTPGSEQ